MLTTPPLPGCSVIIKVSSYHVAPTWHISFGLPALLTSQYANLPELNPLIRLGNEESLKVQDASESPGVLVKTQVMEPHLQNFWFKQIWVGLRRCISNMILMLPAPGPHLENAYSIFHPTLWLPLESYLTPSLFSGELILLADTVDTKMPKLLPTCLPFYPIWLRPGLHVLISHILGTSFSLLDRDIPSSLPTFKHSWIMLPLKISLGLAQREEAFFHPQPSGFPSVLPPRAILSYPCVQTMVSNLPITTVPSFSFLITCIPPKGYSPPNCI